MPGTGMWYLTFAFMPGTGTLIRGRYKASQLQIGLKVLPSKPSILKETLFFLPPGNTSELYMIVTSA
jgi:hypothetical protein